MNNVRYDRLITSLPINPVPGGYAQAVIVSLKNGRFLFAEVMLSNLIERAVHSLQLSPGSFIFVIDSEGTLLFNSSKEITKDDVLKLRYVNTFTDYSLKDRVYRIKGFSLESPSSICENLRGINFLIGVDYSQMLAGINAGLRWGFFLTGGFGTLVGLILVLLGFYLKNKTGIILKRTEEIALGDFDKEIAIRFPNEFQNIAHNINELSRRLRILTQEKVKSAKLSAIGRFAAHMVHDLRNPLYGISLIVSELKKLIRPDDPKVRYYNELISGIERLGEIIDHIAEHGKIYEPRLEMVDLNRLIKETITEFTESYKCEIDFQSRDIGFLNLDPGQWRRVFLNLFKNSYDAKKEDCRIMIRIYTREMALHKDLPQSVIIEVSDFSGGIDPSVMKNLFEPFTTTKRKGLGLGLSFVKEIVEVHNGRIDIENNPGIGVKFIITLPANISNENR